LLAVKRRLPKLISIACVVLALACAILAIVGWRDAFYDWQPSPHFDVVVARRGYLFLEWNGDERSIPIASIPSGDPNHWYVRLHLLRMYVSVVDRIRGYDFDGYTNHERRQRHISASIPVEIIVVVLLVAAGLFAIRSRRERRRQGQSLCAVCGYDLRAAPERCPECGTAMPVPEAENPRGQQPLVR
jgi:hypothetical protein